MSNVLTFTTTEAASAQILRILNWNRKRNNLEFNADLEVTMLTEEANEFYMAESLVDRLDAFCDFCFVATGTMVKFAALKTDSAADLLLCCEDMDRLVGYINVTKAQMKDLLLGELATYHKAFAYDDNHIDEVFSKAMEIVIEANEQKGLDRSENGKVLKPAGFVRPEAKLEALLREYGIDI